MTQHQAPPPGPGRGRPFALGPRPPELPSRRRTVWAPESLPAPRRPRRPHRRATLRLTTWQLPQPLRDALRLPLAPLAILLVGLVIPAVFADLLAPHHPYNGVLADRLLPPVWDAGGTWTYPLGTDKLGRDMLTRIIYGARISLSVALAVIVVSGTIGVGLGLVAGYFGGWIDRIVMAVTDFFLSLPLIFLALALVASLGRGFFTVMVAVGMGLWPVYARQVRGEVLSVREQDYVARARVTGASHGRIILVHILPNVTNTIIVLATLEVGSVILLESALSFLGVGIPRPYPSWGTMVADGRDHVLGHWWLATAPGLAILAVVLSVNMFGDWLRDHLDPKLRHV